MGSCIALKSANLSIQTKSYLTPPSLQSQSSNEVAQVHKASLSLVPGKKATTLFLAQIYGVTGARSGSSPPTHYEKRSVRPAFSSYGAHAPCSREATRYNSFCIALVNPSNPLPVRSNAAFRAAEGVTFQVIRVNSKDDFFPEYWLPKGALHGPPKPSSSVHYIPVRLSSFG